MVFLILEKNKPVAGTTRGLTTNRVARHSRNAPSSLAGPHQRANTPEAADISLRSLASRKTANRNSINPD